MYGFTLSDEQHAFVDAIRDLAQRECGTREQRDALTDNNTEPHNPALYKKVADLGWLGVAIPDRVRRLRRRHGRPVPVPRGDLLRTGADRRLSGQRDLRRPVRALRYRRAEARDPHAASPAARSRRSRCPSRRPARTSATCAARPSVATAATSSTARRRGSPRHSTPSTSCSSAARRPAPTSTRG